MKKLLSLCKYYQQLSNELIVPAPTMQQLLTNIHLELFLLGRHAPTDIINTLNTNQTLVVDRYLQIALDGNHTQLNILLQYCEQSPQKGSECLAIHGSKAAAEQLLHRLQQAAFAPIVAPAWFWITGQQLANKPILPTLNAPTLPDYQQAQYWWETNEKNWPDDERRIAGKPLTRIIIEELQLVWSGRASIILGSLGV